MSVKQKTLNIACKLLNKTIAILGGSNASLISAQLVEELSPTVCIDTDVGVIQFFCPGKLPHWRAKTILTKEPETLDWISTFKKADILWDIGANVGVYSLYAAAKGHSVLAFEPSPGNYYLLSRNTEINKLDNKILAYCIAFSDATTRDTFFMGNTELGSALNNFGEENDWQGKHIVAKLRQAMLGFTIDDFIEQFSPPFPNHIKVDVDGIEDKIINGAKKTLADKRCKSVLVELDAEKGEYCQRVTKVFESSGLMLAKKQVATAFVDSKFTGLYNHIFVRAE